MIKGKLLDWIGNKLTELSIAQLPGYSEEDKELLKKWKNMTEHIRDDRKKLLTSKMMESQATFFAESPKPEKIIEKKITKTQQILDFFSQDKEDEYSPPNKNGRSYPISNRGLGPLDG